MYIHTYMIMHTQVFCTYAYIYILYTGICVYVHNKIDFNILSGTIKTFNTINTNENNLIKTKQNNIYR